METDKTYLKVGKIGTTYGIKGWLKIHTYTEFGASILEYSPWRLANQDGKVIHTLDVEEGRHHGGGIIAKLTGYDTPEDARLLTGLTITIARSQLPKLNKDEYYWSDLEGLSVYNTRKELLGTVAYLIETGSNDAIVIKQDKKEFAIPYLKGTVIKQIDLDKGEIIVDWELI